MVYISIPSTTGSHKKNHAERRGSGQSCAGRPDHHLYPFQIVQHLMGCGYVHIFYKWGYKNIYFINILQDLIDFILNNKTVCMTRSN